MKEILGLLYQTRQPAYCFGSTGEEMQAPESGDVGCDETYLQLTANWRGYYTEGRGLARRNSAGL
jgi:hypothetical protein